MRRQSGMKNESDSYWIGVADVCICYWLVSRTKARLYSTFMTYFIR